MVEIKNIAIALLELYLTLGIMLVGFGYMVAGKAGGQRAAEFYFARSLRWTFARLRALFMGLVALLWTVIVVLIARPLRRALRRGWGALFTRRPRTVRAGR